MSRLTRSKIALRGTEAGAPLHSQPVHLLRELATELLEEVLPHQLVLQGAEHTLLDLMPRDRQLVGAWVASAKPVVDDWGCVELLPLVNNWQQFDTSLVVCRGFSDVIEGGPSSLDPGDDVVDGLGPHEGLGRRSSVMPTRRLRLRPAQTQPEVRPCVTVRSGLLRVPAEIGQRRTR